MTAPFPSSCSLTGLYYKESVRVECYPTVITGFGPVQSHNSHNNDSALQTLSAAPTQSRFPVFRTMSLKMLGICSLLPLCHPVLAEEQAIWGLCPALAEENLVPSFATDLNLDESAVEANEMSVTPEGVTTLTGDVKARHNDNVLYAEEVEFDENQTELDARGAVQFWTDGIYWEGEHAHIDRPQNISTFDQGYYRLLERRGHGRAGHVVDEATSDITYLTDVEYTTCPGGPETNTPWRLKSKDLKLDHNSNWGRALHTVVKIKDIPVFYTPYISFPLTDERMSGFLAPTFGSTKDSGFDFRIPYYWNIAPNMDATFTPRYLSDRGPMLGTEFRYLRPGGRGDFEFELLPSDNLEGSDRYLFAAQLTQRFANSRGRIAIDFSQASDEQYFEDLSSSLDITAQRFLRRSGSVSYRGSWWSVLGRVLSFQSVDASLLPTQGPYDQLPLLAFSTVLPEHNRSLNYSFKAHTVYFDHAHRPFTGNRTSMTAGINFPIRNAGSFLVPSVKLLHNQYFLSRNDGLDDNPSTTLPIASVDGGLFFERNLTLGGADLLHTLEPRFFYVYIPFEDQSEIPVFDTGQFDTSYAQLFQENRFNSVDRIGDANQLTYAITSRLIERHTGRERLSASIGQIKYFRDRKVTLPGRVQGTTNTSSLVAQISSQVTDTLRAMYDIQWNPHDNFTEKASFNLRYQPSDKAVLNLAYRMRKTNSDIEQTDVSFRWPFKRNWSAVGRWNYSLQNQRTIESMFGLEYDSCCWATRLVARHFLRNTEGEYDDAIFLQFELKGLAGFGRSTGDLLERNIPGFHDEF